MHIEYALIANNASVLISKYSEFGSIISIANQIKKQTGKNIDEYVVMNLTCELLSIFDHLHSISVIHADVKPDNILLMQKYVIHIKIFKIKFKRFFVLDYHIQMKVLVYN